MFKRIGVIGAGAMGRGIAQLFASSGQQVLLFDTRAEAIEDAILAVDDHARGNFRRLPGATETRQRARSRKVLPVGPCPREGVFFAAPRLRRLHYGEFSSSHVDVLLAPRTQARYPGIVIDTDTQLFREKVMRACKFVFAAVLDKSAKKR